jgi:hypothetical protein
LVSADKGHIYTPHIPLPLFHHRLYMYITGFTFFFFIEGISNTTLVIEQEKKSEKHEIN